MTPACTLTMFKGLNNYLLFSNALKKWTRYSENDVKTEDPQVVEVFCLYNLS